LIAWHEDPVPPSRALRPGTVPGDQHSADPVFRAAVAEIEVGIAEQRSTRPEISFDSEPPPRRLAPQAAAVAAVIEVDGQEIGWGRFVLLYDPAGQDGWAGPFRVIAYVRAELEPEIAADPLIGGVGWSWLTEALDARAAGYAAPSGTVTRVVTEGFGTKHDEPVATEFEMRASWSPTAAPGSSFDLDRHLAAWADALCHASGLPPLQPGVTQLRPAQLRSQQSRQSRPRRGP
jgi:Protein of unknown function (DUF3000)